MVVTQVLTDEAVSPGANAYETDVIMGDRHLDENASVVFLWDDDPGTHTGTLILKGKLHDDAPFADVYTRDPVNRIEIDVSEAGTPNFSIIGSGLPWMYEQKWSTTDDNVANATTVQAHYLD